MNNERYFTLGTLALSVAFSTGAVQSRNINIKDFSPYNNYISVITEPSTYNNSVIFYADINNTRELTSSTVIPMMIAGTKKVTLNGARKRTLAWF